MARFLGGEYVPGIAWLNERQSAQDLVHKETLISALTTVAPLIGVSLFLCRSYYMPQLQACLTVLAKEVKLSLVLGQFGQFEFNQLDQLGKLGEFDYINGAKNGVYGVIATFSKVSLSSMVGENSPIYLAISNLFAYLMEEIRKLQQVLMF
jgi:hypothetical protein